MSPTMTEMPRYECHKKVWALKIKEVRASIGDSRIGLVFENPLFSPREVSDEYHNKHQPQAGGYYVQYEDGYESWSPAEVFESGYTLINNDRKL